MMPVVPTAKRSHGFTIDSLMSKDPPLSVREPRPIVVSPTSKSSPPSPPTQHSPRESTTSTNRLSSHRSSPEAVVAPPRPRSTSCRSTSPVARRTPTSAATPINLTASAEAATVPPLTRDGFLSTGGVGSGGGGGGAGMPHGPPHALMSSFHPVHGNAALLSSMKSLYAAQEAAQQGAAAYPDGLAAAAALGFPVPLAATTAHGAGLGPSGLPVGLMNGPGTPHPGLPGVSPHPLLLGPHREHFSLYPWLMSRHGGYFGPSRFPGHDASHLLLQPFRKPKRIRTAFSPSQLLRLEHAFEKNHYVVGQERKDLAVNLSLTETQVKVWFQNRRTKYKRMKAEESESERGDNNSSSGGRAPRSPGSPRSDGDDDDDDDACADGGRDSDSDRPLDVSSNPEGEEEELEMVVADDEEEDEIIDCVNNPEDEERPEHISPHHHHPLSLGLTSSNPLMSSSVLHNSNNRNSLNHSVFSDPRLLGTSSTVVGRGTGTSIAHHPASPASPGAADHHQHGNSGYLHNTIVPSSHGEMSPSHHYKTRPHQTPIHVLARPPRSPSPSAVKTAHHAERWRSETNQAQAV